jgi:hypothetical protein
MALIQRGIYNISGDELIFDNYEIRENGINNFEINNNGTNVLTLDNASSAHIKPVLKVGNNATGIIRTEVNGQVGAQITQINGVSNIYLGIGNNSTQYLTMDETSFSLGSSVSTTFNGNANFFNPVVMYDDLKILNNSSVGIGSNNPTAILTLENGGMHLDSSIGNNTTRPALTTGSTNTPYEIRAIGTITSNATPDPVADDGFLRLRAGGGTNTYTASYIDLSGYNAIGDMNNNIIFGTYGIERMRIDVNGNTNLSGRLTMGTLLTPTTYAIEIEKGIADTGIVFKHPNNNTGALIGLDTSGNVIISQSNTSDNIRIVYNAIDRLIFNNSYAYFTNSNVGIGNSTPTYPLDVAGQINSNSIMSIINSNSSYSSPLSTNVPVLRIDNTNNSSLTAHSILLLRTGGSSGGDPFISFDIANEAGFTMGLDNNDSNKFKFSTVWSSFNSTKMTIDRSGYVGIGTTEPKNIFHIQANPSSSFSSAITTNISNPSFMTITATAGYGTRMYIEQLQATSNTNRVMTWDYYPGQCSFNTLNDAASANVKASIFHIDTAEGMIGFNSSSPLCPVHIKQRNDNAGGNLANYNEASIIFERAGNTNKWAIAQNQYHDLVFFYNMADRGYLWNGANVAQIDFTGQHRSQMDTPEKTISVINNINDYIGIIVSSNGEYIDDNVEINEALPKVILSNINNDKKVYGVISEAEDLEKENREYKQGTFVTVIKKQEGDDRIIINSLGEGGIWVSNVNGNFENGDYITTTELLEGYGAKQNDDILHNYTVAKITQDEDFKDMTNGRVINGIKCKFVGCTYHCG